MWETASGPQVVAVLTFKKMGKRMGKSCVTDFHFLREMRGAYLPAGFHNRKLWGWGGGPGK